MKRSFLISLKEWLVRGKKEPWAVFETSGIDEEGRIAFSISTNKAFIKHLHAFGIQGTNDEETVQLFFLFTKMAPDAVGTDPSNAPVNPIDLPNLSSESNKYVL